MPWFKREELDSLRRGPAPEVQLFMLRKSLTQGLPYYRMSGLEKTPEEEEDAKDRKKARKEANDKFWGRE